MFSLYKSDEARLRRDALILALFCGLSVGVYLLVSGLYFRVGFPLDDSWIHQTYARNLAWNREWAFLPGQSSGGSTSPLWTVLLSVGYLLGLSPYVWTYLLGFLFLWGLSILGEVTVRQMADSYRPAFPWAGVLLAMEWHLVWAAVSGMETILQAFLATVVLFMVTSGSPRPLLQGLLVGLCIWVRPDGVTLLGPVLLAIFLQKNTSLKQIAKSFALVFLGFGVLFGFYLLFNLLVAGTAWPNTFYAKQAEYASYLQFPIITRIAQQFMQPIIGIGVLLAAGFLYRSFAAFRRKAWTELLGVIWIIGFLFLYAWRLPVVYQHGRYVMTVIPLFIVVGLLGILEFFRGHTVGRFYKRTGSLLTATILVLFWCLGAYAYARDVSYIESEMVEAAEWVAGNTPEDALIAAHDIGALGYFGNRQLVDLAGLISPDVIPILRDEAALAAYLNRREVDFLVIFPDWYETLALDLELVHSTKAPFAPAMGGTNMAIYRWRDP